ncbi:MAG: MFS transporter [Pseudomonadota bacterium]
MAIGALLRAPGFGAFLAGRTAAATGTWMERLALGWMVWEATGSTGWLGAVAFLRLAPTLVAGPWGGVLADRAGAVPALARAEFALAAMLAALAAAAWLGDPPPAALAAAALALGAAQALANAPAKAAVARLSPPELVATAIPVNSVVFHAAAFVGPALAGVTIAVAGPAPVFLAAALASAAFAMVLRSGPPERRDSADLPAASSGFLAALPPALHHPIIRPTLMLHAAFALLLRPIVDLLPAVAGAVGSGGAAMLGLLTGAMGLGAAAGGAWLALRGGAPGLERRMLGGGAVAIAAALALAAAQEAAVAAAALAVLGAALTVRAAGGTTLVQLAVADALRGRVMAAWGVTLRVGAALGGLTLGLAAEAFGLRVVLAAAAALAATALLRARVGLRRAQARDL